MDLLGDCFRAIHYPDPVRFVEKASEVLYGRSMNDPSTGLIDALTSGGDERIALDPATGRNKYLCPPVPWRGGVVLSSCTASPICDLGYQEATIAHQRIAAASLPSVEIAAHVEALRTRLGRVFDVAGLAEIILCPSGTDATLTAAALLVAERPNEPTTMILPAAAETGTGVPCALECRAFGANSGAAKPILATPINSVEIPLRDAMGEPEPEDRVNAAFARAAASVRGRAIIILTHGTKTGLVAPTEIAATEDVIVDASQGRIDHDWIGTYLRRGWPVVLTGSKFFGGPAFSGAALFPSDRWRARRALPIGLADHAALPGVAGGQETNLGMALRWTAAMAAMERFSARPSPPLWNARMYWGAIDRGIGECPSLVAVGGLPYHSRAGFLGGQTIFTFGARDPSDPQRMLSMTEVRGLYENLAWGGVLLGQPVDLGPFGGLRIAMGARELWDEGKGYEPGLAKAFSALKVATTPRCSSKSERVHPPSLDPEDWTEMRAIGHRMLDDAFDDLAGVAEGPVWRQMPPAIRDGWAGALPRAGTSLSQTYAEYRWRIAPYGVGNRHRKFFGWVHGGGSAVGMLAEMLAGGLNANCGGRDHAPIACERQVIRWAAEMLGLPMDSSGLVLSGTSMANMVAVLIARAHALGEDVRRDGVTDAKLTGYISAGAHLCVGRAFDMAGLGSDALRPVPCDGSHAMRVPVLRERIAADRAAGLRPFLVVATAGSVDVGAIDDLTAIARVCAEEGLWFHVDAAFGAIAMLSPALRPLFAGMEMADSVAFDFHKWAQVPYEAGCIVVRDGAAQRRAVAGEAAYLRRDARGLAVGEAWPVDLGPELSRGFRALKVWMTLKTYGADRIGKVAERGCTRARRLAAAVDVEPLLERLAPVPLNIVCFRHRLGDDAFQAALAADLQEAGDVVLSTTMIGGRAALRAAIVNHRTAEADVDAVVAAALAAARRRDADDRARRRANQQADLVAAGG